MPETSFNNWVCGAPISSCDVGVAPCAFFIIAIKIARSRHKEFRHSFLEEKVKLDIEYRLEELKRDIQTRKSPKELIKKVNSIEQYVMSV